MSRTNLIAAAVGALLAPALSWLYVTRWDWPPRRSSDSRRATVA